MANKDINNISIENGNAEEGKVKDNKVSFEDAELYFLADAVMSAKFMSVEQKNKLFTNIFSLANRNTLNRYKRLAPFSAIDFLEDMFSYNNGDFVYKKREDKNFINSEWSAILCFLENAFFENNVKFNYSTITQGCENSGVKAFIKEVNVCPFAIVYSDGYYYLIGESYGNLVSYRVDRMSNLVLNGEWKYSSNFKCLVDDVKCFEGKYSNGRESNFNFPQFRSGILGGFSWETEDGIYCHSDYFNVILKVKKEITGDIYDKFGKKIKFFEEGNGLGDWYTVQVKLLNAESSFLWLAQFGDKIKILSPDILIEDYKEYLNKILDIYNS